MNIKLTKGSIYGESNRMKLILLDNNNVVLKSRLLVNFMIFLVMILLPALFLELLNINTNTAIAYVAIVLIIIFTYRKAIVFSRDKNSVMYYSNIFGIKVIRSYSFEKILDVEIITKESLIAGVQLPLLINKYCLGMRFSDGKYLAIDSSSDEELMKKYKDIIINMLVLR